MISKTIGSAVAANNTGSATADYTSVAAWEAAIGNTDDETGTVITMVAAADTSSVTVNASNTGPYTYLLTADSSTYLNAATYAALTSRARLASSSGECLIIQCSGFIVEKLGIIGAPGRAITYSNNATMRRLGITAISSAPIVGDVSGKTGIVSNCFAITISTGSVGYAPVGGSIMDIYQSSQLTDNSTYSGYYTANPSTQNIYGCICQGAFNNNFYKDGGTYGGDYNVSRTTGTSGADNWFTHYVSGLTGAYVSETTSSEDFALTSGSIVNIVNRSGFPSDTDTDIVGSTRPSTGADAGVWQTPIASVGPGPIDNTIFSRRGKGRTLPTPATIGY